MTVLLLNHLLYWMSTQIHFAAIVIDLRFYIPWFIWLNDGACKAETAVLAVLAVSAVLYGLCRMPDLYPI
jgi:hypothetical protein